MEDNEMKKCPYCAEMIRSEAIKCRYCGSMLTRKPLTAQADPHDGYWRRVREGKKIAGVCTGLARQFEAPVLILPLRVLFVVTTMFYGFGLVFYVVLWLLMPPPQEQEYQPTAAETPSRPTPPPPSPRAPRPVYDESRYAPPMVDRYPGHSEAGPAAAPAVEVPGRDEPNETPSPEPENTDPAGENGRTFDLGAGEPPAAEKDK